MPPERPLFFIAIFHLTRPSQGFNSPMEKDPEPGTGAVSIATEEREAVRSRLGRSSFVERVENRFGRTVSPSAPVADITKAAGIRAGVHRKDHALGNAN